MLPLGRATGTGFLKLTGPTQVATSIYVHLKLDKNENPVFRLPQPLVSYLDVVTLRTFPLLQGILDSELLEAELSPSILHTEFC